MSSWVSCCWKWALSGSFDLSYETRAINANKITIQKRYCSSSKMIQNKVEPALFLSIFSGEMSTLVFLLMRSGTFSSDRSTPLHRTPALQYTVICHKPNVWFWKMHGFLYISSHGSFRVFASSPTYQKSQVIKLDMHIPVKFVLFSIKELIYMQKITSPKANQTLPDLLSDLSELYR